MESCYIQDDIHTPRQLVESFHMQAKSYPTKSLEVRFLGFQADWGHTDREEAL
jgi:hypothetical protein